MDFLKELIGDELANQVIEKLGDKKLIIDDGTLIKKENFNVISEKYKQAKQQLEEQKNEYETQLNEVNAKLTEFEGFSKLSTEQKQQISDLKTKNESMQSEYNTKLESIKKDSMIDLALIKDGAIEPREVRVHLDLDKISVDGENLNGYQDQIKAVKEKNSRLFGTVEVVGDAPPCGGNPIPKNEKQKSLETLQKQYKEKPNPNLGAQIIALQRSMRNEQT